MKSILKYSLLFALLFSLMSCGNTDNKENSQNIETKQEVVKIGVIAPLSGDASAYGQDAVNTYQMSVDEFNATSDVQVELIIEDGKCNGKDAVSAVQKLINLDKIDFILGGVCSSETIAAGKIAQKKKITMLSPISSSPDISDMGDYIFRHWNDAHAGAGLSDHLNKKYKKIHLVVENTDYAKALSKKVIAGFTGEFVDEIYFNSNEKDFGIIANRIEKNDSEAIVFLNQTETTGISMIKSLDKKGLIEKYGKENIIGAYLFSGKNFKEAIGDLGIGLVQINLDSESSKTEKGLNFIKEFEKIHEIQFDASFIYLEKEAIDFILDSINDGVRDSEGLKAALNNITEQNPRDGFFGEYYIDENGDAIGLKYSMEVITAEGAEKIK